jgi:hypothetical protein
LAIIDLLNWFKIENSGYTVSSEQLINVEPQFIAFAENFVAVTKINEKDVTLSDNKQKNHKAFFDEFKKDCVGVVLTANAPLKNKNSSKV